MLLRIFEVERSLGFAVDFFIDPYIPKDDTMDTLSSPTVTIDESQYRSKGNISKRLKNRFLRKQIMNLKSTFEKYWNTLAELRSLTKSIDETILTILKPSLDHGVLTSIADEKPPLSRLKDLKKPHLSSSLREVEDVLKIISKAEVAQLSENRAGNAGDKAQEAKEEAKKINDELRHKIPQTEKFVQSSITEFASEYLNFVDEEVEVEKKCRSVMRNWLFPKSSKPTAETKNPIVGSGEYANSDTVKDPVAPTKSSLSSIARSQPSVSEENEDNENSTKDHEADDLCSLPAPFKVVALYPYKAQEDDELDMTQNDVIKVIDRGDDVEKEPGWLYGKNKRTGKSGLFPTNHVKKLD
ncbi:hypothetical protein AAHC03_04690 [Spirometra sp. Aus1]